MRFLWSDWLAGLTGRVQAMTETMCSSGWARMCLTRSHQQSPDAINRTPNGFGELITRSHFPFRQHLNVSSYSTILMSASYML